MKPCLTRIVRATALLGGLIAERVLANPHGAMVSQGSASFSRSGSQLTITTSDQAFINWKSFNVWPGQTTTFVQPSANSVVWNQINGSLPSQILGNVNANGYVILQNQSGFYIGGQAVLSAHGLIMTTAPIPAPDLASGSPWQFNMPPPASSIINYGSISLDNGGSVFLIANNIENHGTISAPQGSIGLLAGQQVLVSERPDGLGLSAKVTLPAGSVDNSGKLIADAGTIALQAEVVNQGGLVQANSIKNINGTIELLASDSINLTSSSVISAAGDNSASSAGGQVTIKSDNTFSDQANSTINIAGGVNGGNGGQVEISAPQISAIQSTINGTAAAGFAGGVLTIDPDNIKLVSNSGDTPPANGIVNPGDPNSPGSPDTLTLDVTKFSSTLSQINLQATKNIEIATVWTLRDTGAPASLTLTAGNNITLDSTSDISSSIPASISAAGQWSVNLNAGTKNLTTAPLAQTQGVYLNGGSFIQTQKGDINIWAANEVIINSGSDAGNDGIRTLKGGNIQVTTDFGDVNTGANFKGYTFLSSSPYYTVSTSLGGISTAAGGNVTIKAARGNVIGFEPFDGADDTQNPTSTLGDGGTGAFGGGNVDIEAGKNISGHFVLANGTGTIHADGTIGDPVTPAKGFALSLIKGAWTVTAGVDLYVQDVRNPNGILNDTGGTGSHLFDYDPNASVSLTAGNNIEITGNGAPHLPASGGGVEIPFIFPPNLYVDATGSFEVDTSVTLFPSIARHAGDTVSGNLTIKTGGDFFGNGTPDGSFSTLMMSDSPSQQWTGDPDFTYKDPNHALLPPELSNPNLTPVNITVGGTMQNINLFTTAPTVIKVTHGDMFNVTFVGENLRPGDITSITVAGLLSYPSLYAFNDPAFALTQPIASVDPLNPTAWDEIFSLLVSPQLVAATPVPVNATLKQIAAAANQLKIFQGTVANPGFLYDPGSLQLGYQGQMLQSVRDVFDGNNGPLQIIKLDALGNPVVQRGQASLGQDPTQNYFVTVPVTFAPAATIDNLFAKSNDPLHPFLPSDATFPTGLQIGGPGLFDVHAGQIDLGVAQGIRSVGYSPGNAAARDYSTLAPFTDSGADLTVTADGNLSMLTSTIGSFAGGTVTVTSTGGEIDLGLANLFFIPPSGTIAYGIYTTGGSPVNVTALDDINILASRIGTFNGGKVTITSEQGNVNAGNGVNRVLVVPLIYKDSAGAVAAGTIDDPKPFGSGILAISPKEPPPGSTGVPGDIVISTPNGDILSTLGGIQQLALGRDIVGGTITMTAGTAPSGGSAGHPGNVDLGLGGVIGGNINITAQGDIKGLIVSRENSNIQAAQNFSGTVLSGGTANVSATAGSISGTVIGISGVSASGGQGVTADVLSQNVSVQGQAATSTLGTTAAATSTGQAAAAQANTETKQQVALTDTQDDDDNKKKAKRPTLTRRSRVTVILPKT